MKVEWKAELYNLQPDELDTVIWRYLTFPKFIHMITYGALWFCRLDELQDEFEGHIPDLPLNEMKTQHEELKKHYSHPDHHKQISEMAERNISDGRFLTAVNCWFINDVESKKMWDEYVGSEEGVAIKSTIGKVRDSVYLNSARSHIGRVEYIDFKTHPMSTYEANQAHHRSFLKDKKYSHEKELRLSTFNSKTPACLNPLGVPYTKEDLAGSGTYNHDPGLIIQAKMKQLFDTVVLAPSSNEWVKNLIVHISQKGELDWDIQNSTLDK